MTRTFRENYKFVRREVRHFRISGVLFSPAADAG